jgi:hypothetical protein
MEKRYKNQLIISLMLFVVLSSFVVLKLTYDEKYVDIITVPYKNEFFKVVYLKRQESGNRIKAKYFAAKDPYNGSSVPTRYKNWAYGKNIICATSGTYMTSFNPNNSNPVGLTIDNGIVVNEKMEEFDGLVIVYATGGIVATNLKEKNLKVQGGTLTGVSLDIKGNAFHRSQFIKWCKEQEATVFQTHLLANKNNLTIDQYTSKSDKRERRFLAVGYDYEGQVVHVIVHSPTYTSLYEGSRRALEFLTDFKEINVEWMINLDTGAQDVFELYNKNGQKDQTILGRLKIEEAVNLLVYYYE